MQQLGMPRAMQQTQSTSMQSLIAGRAYHHSIVPALGVDGHSSTCTSAPISSQLCQTKSGGGPIKWLHLQLAALSAQASRHAHSSCIDARA